MLICLLGVAVCQPHGIAITLPLTLVDYLEYRFGTVKSYNGRNKFVVPLIVRIPYYIWLGCSRARDTARFKHAFEVEGGNIVGTPVLSPTIASPSRTADIGQLDIGPSAVSSNSSSDAAVINVSPPLSSFHYQLKHVGDTIMTPMLDSELIHCVDMAATLLRVARPFPIPHVHLLLHVVSIALATQNRMSLSHILGRILTLTSSIWS